MDYSQNGEQEIILQYFGDFVGRFLEIGACDGLLVSNTLALVERGWSGLMVEPSPRAFIALRDRHGSNPKLTLVHAAAGGDYGLVKFWEESTIGGYSTTEQANRVKWRHLVAFAPPFYVPMIPVSSLLHNFPGPIDFLSIDTEGTSVDIFLAFPFGGGLVERFGGNEPKPRAICVEHDGRIDECLRHAQSWGYQEVSRNAENLVFVLRGV